MTKSTDDRINSIQGDFKRIEGSKKLHLTDMYVTFISFSYSVMLVKVELSELRKNIIDHCNYNYVTQCHEKTVKTLPWNVSLKCLKCLFFTDFLSFIDRRCLVRVFLPILYNIKTNKRLFRFSEFWWNDQNSFSCAFI